MIRLMRAFDPAEALPSHDPRYVDCNRSRGSSIVLQQLAGMIQYHQTASCQLITGHKGGGKTTELKRLAALLNASGYQVAFCEADRYVNLNLVTYTDVLLAVAQSIAEQSTTWGFAPEAPDIVGAITHLVNALNLQPARGEHTATTLLDILTTATQKDLGLRQLCQAYLAKHAAQLVAAVAQLVDAVSDELRRQQSSRFAGLVVIIDNLDRVVRTDVFDEAQYEALFIQPSEIYRSLPCHVVMTVPTGLVHSQAAGKLPFLYSAPPRVVPNLPVTTRQGARYQDGFAASLEVVSRRCTYAQLTQGEAFEDASVVETFCESAGGHFRLLMTLVRQSATVSTQLPISAEAAKAATNDISHFYDRCVRGEHARSILTEVHQTKAIPDDPLTLSLLEDLLVFEYIDSEGLWYDANPMIRLKH